MQLTVNAALIGMMLSAAIALVVGLPPAMRAMRLDIVNALKVH
jgi:hypothetical protein